jgi:hypothetical protein
MTQPRKTSPAGASRPAKARSQTGTQSRGAGRGKKRSASASKKRAPSTRRWSRHVMETSDALDLEPNVFRRGTARQIALSLKRSAERSSRRKSAPFRSAMSMLTFYINRGGKNLSAGRLRVLNQAKDELREVFHRV